jgi:membrane protein YqaA with SNARE-associated domain
MESQKVKERLQEIWAEAKKSATIWVALFWSVITAAAENITLLSGVVSAKWYPFIVILTIAIARMRTLGKK